MKESGAVNYFMVYFVLYLSHKPPKMMLKIKSGIRQVGGGDGVGGERQGINAIKWVWAFGQVYVYQNGAFKCTLCPSCVCGCCCSKDTKGKRWEEETKNKQLENVISGATYIFF